MRKPQSSFDKRVADLWQSQQRMAGAKKWKSGKRAGAVRIPSRPIRFTRDELRAWLWERVGEGAVRCPYLGTPINVHTLTLDHITPRSIGGEFSLDNMQVCSPEANEMKGEMTDGAFRKVLELMWSLGPHDQQILRERLKAAHHGARQRFNRKKR